jgi:hypothetical protein
MPDRPGYTASKAASRMIFTPDRRPKIIPPATFSLSNPGDPVFNNTLLKEIEPTTARFP